MFNSGEVRSQFPALMQKVHGHDLVYLDSAATTLKPQSVIERISKFYSNETANVHRGAHYLADTATSEFELARETIRQFVNAKSTEEIIFTRGTTESVNLVAQCFGDSFIQEGDEIVVSEMEHHSNLVPWQLLAERKKASLKYISVLANGEFDLHSVERIITSKTKLVAFTGCSNILGTITPIEVVVKKAKSVGAVTLLDAAQYVTQKKVDVLGLDVDFLVFSSHKLFGPFGFGVLYGRKELLEKMPPYQFGGSMISTVEFEKTSFNSLPYKFEAGTPHVEGAVGTKAAIDFINRLGKSEIFEYEQGLLKLAHAELKSIEGLKIFGEAKEKASIVSFTLEGAHHSDIGQILDQYGIAVRVGNHCTQPLLKKFGMTGTVRASFSVYNNQIDIERLVEGVKKAKRMLL